MNLNILCKSATKKNIALILFSFAITAPTHAVEKDKALHFGVSSVIGAASYGYTNSWSKSMAMCMSVGLAKELYDEKSYGGFDEKDLAADAIGCVTGSFMAKGFKLITSDDQIFLRYEIDL